LYDANAELLNLHTPDLIMRPRDRVISALNHREPDCVPFDLGGTDVTGINCHVYRSLLPLLGLDVPKEIPILDIVQQIANIDEKALHQLQAHCRAVFPNSPSNWKLEVFEDNGNEVFKDEWGIAWRKPKQGGLYFDIKESPLKQIDWDEIVSYPWPNPIDPNRLTGLKDRIQHLHDDGEYAIVLSGITGGGAMEVSAWLSGFENFFSTMLIDPKAADALLDKILEIKLGFWQSILPSVKDFVQVISESEDLGMQDRLLVSPATFKQHIKPRLRQLITGIKKIAPDVKVFLHSDGAILEILPDLIEIGVDILNPVQVSAKGMGDTALLKREFGKDLVFWGGIDTQKVLPFSSPKEVEEEVKRRLDDLAPGGGYVMATVHNIQFNTPPENVLAMFRAWQKFGAYN
jgi:uroporphyrinogen decarboxylase